MDKDYFGLTSGRNRGKVMKSKTVDGEVKLGLPSQRVVGGEITAAGNRVQWAPEGGEKAGNRK